MFIAASYIIGMFLEENLKNIHKHENKIIHIPATRDLTLYLTETSILDQLQ